MGSIFTRYLSKELFWGCSFWWKMYQISPASLQNSIFMITLSCSLESKKISQIKKILGLRPKIRLVFLQPQKFGCLHFYWDFSTNIIKNRVGKTVDKCCFGFCSVGRKNESFVQCNKLVTRCHSVSKTLFCLFREISNNAILHIETE